MHPAHVAIALILIGLALFPVPRGWRIGMLVFCVGLILAPVAIAVYRR